MASLNLRIPDDLHEHLRAAAARSRRSLNSEILARLEVDFNGSAPPLIPQPGKRSYEPDFKTTATKGGKK